MDVGVKGKHFKFRTEEDLRKDAKRIARNKVTVPKTTHIFMHEKCLTEIPKPKSPTHVVYAYYQNNHITKIENLELMYNLTHLHMQWNKVTKLDGLERLYNLKKLYLGNNNISVVENLENLRFLEELHLEKQNVDAPDSLCFDPKTVMALGSSLRILDVSENKIRDMSWARPLRRLEVIIAKKNCMEHFEGVADDLCVMIGLVDANFIGNPMTKKHRYKETIIARCAHLRVLDTVSIDNTAKVFLQGFDRAVRLRQMHLNNKSKYNEAGADKFFELNMKTTGPRTMPAVISSVGPASGTYLSNLSGVRAIDSSYTFSHRTLPRAGAGGRPLSAGAPQIGESLSFPPLNPPPPPKQPLTPGRAPLKGILKKPMPMKYI